MNPLLEIVVNEPFQADKIQGLYSNKDDLYLANPKAKFPFSASEWTFAITTNHENTSLLFTLNEEIVGHLALIQNGEHLYLCFVIVKREFRGQGVGKKIIKLAEEFVRLNYTHNYLYLNVHTQNTLALNLYKHMGYQTENQFNDQVAMRKELRVL